LGEKLRWKHRLDPQAAAEDRDFVMACVGNDDDLRAITIGADGAFAGMKSRQVLSITLTRLGRSRPRNFDKAATKAASNSSTPRVGRPGRRGEWRAHGDVLRQRGWSTSVQKRVIWHTPRCASCWDQPVRPVAQMVNQIMHPAGCVEALSAWNHSGRRRDLMSTRWWSTISKGAAQSCQMDNRYKDHERTQVMRRCG